LTSKSKWGPLWPFRSDVVNTNVPVLPPAEETTPLPPELMESGLVGIDAANPLGTTVQSAIDQMAKSLRDALPDTLEENRMLYLSRGDGKVRWFPDPVKGYNIQKDEYAENVPQAMLEACKTLGWAGVILYAGRAPAFNVQNRSFESIYPETALELDYTALGSHALRLRSASRNLFNARWNAARKDPNWHREFSYKGVDFHDQLDPLMDSFIPAMSATFVSEYARWKAVFQVLKPKVVFAGRLDTNSPLLKAAREEEVLTANIKLGIGEEMLAPFYFRDKMGEFDASVMPDLHLLWGDRQASMLDQRFIGHPSDWVSVGRTRNDSFVTDANVTIKGRLLEFINLEDGAKIIIYGANHRTFYARDAGDEDGICCLSWASYTKNLKALDKIAKSRPDCYIVVKPHPSDDIAKIEHFVSGLGERTKLVTNASGLHNNEILADSIMFVSSVSSMFSEALVSDCLPISLWLDDVNFLYESGRRDMFDAMAVTVRETNELVDTVTDYLNNSCERDAEIVRLRSGLSGYFGEIDGRNAERAINEALKVLNARSSARR